MKVGGRKPAPSEKFVVRAGSRRVRVRVPPGPPGSEDGGLAGRSQQLPAVPPGSHPIPFRRPAGASPQVRGAPLVLAVRRNPAGDEGPGGLRPWGPAVSSIWWLHWNLKNDASVACRSRESSPRRAVRGPGKAVRGPGRAVAGTRAPSVLILLSNNVLFFNERYKCVRCESHTALPKKRHLLLRPRLLLQIFAPRRDPLAFFIFRLF